MKAFRNHDKGAYSYCNLLKDYCNSKLKTKIQITEDKNCFLWCIFVHLYQKDKQFDECYIIRDIFLKLIYETYNFRRRWKIHKMNKQLI